MTLRYPRNTSDEPSTSADRNLRALVDHALSIVIERHRSTQDDHTWRPSEGFMERLCQAFVHPNPLRQDLVSSELIGRGYRHDQLAGEIAPNIASRLSTKWEMRGLSSRECATGASRLNEWVLNFGSQKEAINHCRGSDEPTVLLVAPRFEAHTLGLLASVSHFRRAGFCASFALWPADDDLIEMVEQGTFDLIAFSISDEAVANLLASLIAKIKSQLDDVPPIAVGGAVVGSSLISESTLNVDVVENDPLRIAEACNILL